MKNILMVYTVILALGITSLLTGVHYYANIAGFISAIGFMAIFFKDRDNEKNMDETILENVQKHRKYWYIVFSTGLFFSLIFGSFWNNQMGGMA